VIIDYQHNSNTVCKPQKDQNACSLLLLKLLIPPCMNKYKATLKKPPE